MNIESKKNNGPVYTKWIFIEAQTGRGQLDSHFSYVNLVLKSYVEDGNIVLLEEVIFKAMSFNGGIAGTSAVLINCTELDGKCINRNLKAL